MCWSICCNVGGGGGCVGGVADILLVGVGGVVNLPDLNSIGLGVGTIHDNCEEVANLFVRLTFFQNSAGKDCCLPISSPCSLIFRQSGASFYSLGLSYLLLSVYSKIILDVAIGHFVDL